MKIAIFSSANTKIPDHLKALAFEIGVYLAHQGITVVTGGCVGIPGIVVDGALSVGGKTEAFYPDINEASLNLNRDVHNNDRLDKFSYKNFFNGFTERSLRMIHAVDGAIILNGRIGTLSEFTIAIEEGRDVCVIKKTGGIADQLEEIIKIADRELPNKIIFEEDWKKGVNNLIRHITRSNNTSIPTPTNRNR
jgi:hypothetical protein